MKQNHRALKQKAMRRFPNKPMAWLYVVLYFVQYVTTHKVGAPIERVPDVPSDGVGVPTYSHRKEPDKEYRYSPPQSSQPRYRNILPEATRDKWNDVRCPHCQRLNFEVMLGRRICSNCYEPFIVVA
jgi:hypothetical protein